MKTEFQPFPPRPRPRISGFALIVVLAFLVLITGLVLAFFSRAISNRQVSAHSANSIRSERLARGAVDTVLGDLKQEIAAGSSGVVSEISEGTLFATYLPATARSAIPFPTEPGRPANLVKWSAPQPFFDSAAEYDGQPVFPRAAVNPPSQRASSDATTTVSRNGRFVSPARWNRALLLPKANPSATDPTPAVTGDDSFQIPTWIYVDRNGGNPQQTNSDVIGRFAYAIYDAGGLLDMNVAGYPADDSGMPAESQTEPVGRKGILATADLTRIGMSSADSQTLVGWRNHSTLTAGEDRYLELSLEHPNGHLTVGGSGTSADRAFPSRQSLIDFVLKQLSGGSVAERQNYLRYLGINSRDLDAPTWIPDPARPRILGDAANPRDAVLSDGGNMAVGLDDEFNPALPMVRVQHPFERLSGSQARVREPLVKNRFPLERLSWITSDGPSADLPSSDPRYNQRGTGDNIRASFGLAWDNASHAWSYGVNSSGTPFGGRVPQRILRLQEVAALSASEAREPDFFELMQAAIHVGSLGRGFAYYRPTKDTGPFRREEREFGAANNPNPPELLSTQPKYQVLQIGANMIDQYDSDSFPTEIRLNGFRFFGIEDLPYLNRIMMAAQIQDEPAAPSLGSWISYVIPELWNPHDTGQPSPLPPDSPTQFRITISPIPNSGILFSWKTSAAVPPTPNAYPAGFPIQNQNPQLTYQPVAYEFSATSSDFREPELLPASGTLTLAPPATPRMQRAIPVGAFDFISSGSAVSCRKTWPAPVETIANQTIPATYPAPTPEPTTVRNVNQVKTIGSYVITLAYRRNGQWRDYFTFSGMFGSQFPVREVLQDFLSVSLNTPQQALWDPRSNRFPADRSDGAGNSTLWKHRRPDLGPGQNRKIFFQSADNSLLSGWWKTGTTQPGGDPSTAFMGTVSINSANAANVGARNTYYHDPDGVVRGADGVYETTNNYAGQPLALNAKVGGGRNFSRPIILNRPFRSVGELGYVFRDTPWKSIDFFTANSGDSALLDIFCLKENTVTGLRAGVLNPNTRNVEVLEAMIAGTLKDETPLSGTGSAPVPLLNAQSNSLAQALVTTTQTTPLQNRADLVNRFVGSPTAFPLSPNSPDDEIVKRRREAVVRALADVSTTRVWNLMIDVIAQPGRTVNGQFLVEGEKRYWVHVAIDRLTGEVLERSSELVVE